MHGDPQQRAAGGGGSLVGASGSSPASGDFSGWVGPRLDTTSPPRQWVPPTVLRLEISWLWNNCLGEILCLAFRGRCCSDVCGRR
jgi:hypothetical protein